MSFDSGEQGDKLITAYYLGGLGGDDHPVPIRLRGGKIIYTPPIGSAFSQKFTPNQYKDLEMQCGYHDEFGRFITTVTTIESKALQAKNSNKSSKFTEPTNEARIPDADLIKELKARGIDLNLPSKDDNKPSASKARSRNSSKRGD